MSDDLDSLEQRRTERIVAYGSIMAVLMMIGSIATCPSDIEKCSKACGSKMQTWTAPYEERTPGAVPNIQHPQKCECRP